MKYCNFDCLVRIRRVRKIICECCKNVQGIEQRWLVVLERYAYLKTHGASGFATSNSLGRNVENPMHDKPRSTSWTITWMILKLKSYSKVYKEQIPNCGGRETL